MSSDAISSPVAACPERRAHARRSVDLLANRFVEGQPRLLRVVDLSVNGLRAVAIGNSGPHAKFGGLQFQLPGTEEILTASSETVVDAPEGELHLKLTFVPEHTRRRLAEFVATSGARRSRRARAHR